MPQLYYVCALPQVQTLLGMSFHLIVLLGRCEALVAQYCVQVADGLFEALNQTLCGGLDRIVTVM